MSEATRRKLILVIVISTLMALAIVAADLAVGGEDDHVNAIGAEERPTSQRRCT